MATDKDLVVSVEKMVNRKGKVHFKHCSSEYFYEDTYICNPLTALSVLLDKAETDSQTEDLVLDFLDELSGDGKILHNIKYVVIGTDSDYKIVGFESFIDLILSPLLTYDLCKDGKKYGLHMVAGGGCE